MTNTEKTTTAADHPAFTNISWNDEHKHWQHGLSPESRQRDRRLENWMAQHDMAVQLSAKTGMPFEWANVLVPAALSGLPVELTYKLNGDGMTAKQMIIITQLFNGTHFYVKAWGFSHPVYFSRVLNVEAPLAEYNV